MRRALERILMRLLSLVAERKPARPAPAAEPIAVPKEDAPAPHQVKRRDWRLPTAEEIDSARGEASMHSLPKVKICRGPDKGCVNHNWHHQHKCRDCYVVHWHDRRPSAEIVAAMERGDA